MTSKAFSERTDKIFDTLNFILSRIGGGLILLSSVIIVADVIMRYFFGRSLVWVYYVSQYIIVYATFLSATYVLRHDGHVNIDIILIRLNKRTRTYVSIFTSLMGLFFCVLLGWYSWIDAYQGLVKKAMFTAPIAVYEFPIKIVIPFGCLLLSIEWIRKILVAFSHLVRKQVKNE